MAMVRCNGASRPDADQTLIVFGTGTSYCRKLSIESMKRAAYPSRVTPTRSPGSRQGEGDATQQVEGALGPQTLDTVAFAGARALLVQALELEVAAN